MKRLAAVLVIVGALLLTFNNASAAQLKLNGSRSFYAGALSRCDDVVTVAAPTKNGLVRFFDIAEACGGKSINLWVWDLKDDYVGTAQIAKPVGPTEIKLDSSVRLNEAKLTLFVMIDGWPVHTKWADAPVVLGTCAPVDPWVTETCQVAFLGRGKDAYDWWGRGYQFAFQVTTSSAVAFKWELTIDLAEEGIIVPGTSATAFPGWPVPAGSGYSAWTPTRFSGWNMCIDSLNEAVVRIRGSDSRQGYIAKGSPTDSVGFGASLDSGSSAGSDANRCR